MFAFAAIVVIGGLCLAWSRRHSRLLAKRDKWWTILAAICVILSCQTAYREYFGEAAMPCALKAVLEYLQGVLIPSVLVCRCVGLYARHLRQQAILHTAVTSSAMTIASEVQTPPTAMPSPVGPPTVIPARDSGVLSATQHVDARPWHQALDLLLLRLRLDTPAQLRRVVYCWLLPWVAYYVITLGLSPKYRSGAVGCRLDSIDSVAYVFDGIVAASAMFVVLLRLWARPDTLFMRAELAIQLGAWVVCMAWFAYGMFSPTFDISVVNSAYSIHLANVVSFLSSVWLPAILSFADEDAGAPPILLAQLGRYMPVDMSRTSMTSLVATGTSGAGDGAETTSVAEAAGLSRPRAFADSTTNQDLTTDSVVSQWHLARQHAVDHTYSETTLVTPVRVADADADCMPAPGDLLASLAALPHLFEPAPSEQELVEILQQPAQTTLCDARALRLFAGALLVCDSGRHMLYEALKREFSAELLGFMLACADVRLASRRVIPVEAWKSTLARGRYRRHALPSVRQASSAPVFFPEAESTLASERVSSEPVTRAASANASANTNVSTTDPALAMADVFATLSFLRSQFIAEGAPHQINISADQVCPGRVCAGI